MVQGLPRLGDQLRAVAESIDTSQIAAQVREGIRALVEDVGPQIARALETLKEDYDWLVPANWRELTIPEMITLSDLMRDEGWGLVWVPSPDVLRRLLAEPDIDARKQKLLSLEGMVLADLDRALDSVSDPQLAGLVGVARQVAETYRSGYWLAAQALAAAALSTAIHDHLDRKFGKAKRDFERTEDVDELELIDWRIGMVPSAIFRAIDDYDYMTGAPERPHFNRHASLHRVEPPQYSEANALAATMLLVCVVRELEWIGASIRREEAREKREREGGKEAA